MKIVQKPWGREEIWAETDRYAGKMLYINKSHQLSRQYHKKKEETIRVLEGTLTLELGPLAGETITMVPGSIFHIKPGIVHRFCAQQTDVVLIEVSTPELDDVVRIQDDYDRLDYNEIDE